MASLVAKKTCAILAAIPLLIVSIILFVLMIVLGAWGIVEAQVANPCAGVNVTGISGCEPILTLNAQGSPDTNSFISLRWTHWLAGSTAAGVLWAVFSTLALVSLIAAIALFDTRGAKPSVVRTSSVNVELQPTASGHESADGADDEEFEQKTITIGAAIKKDFTAKPVRMLTVGASFGLFFCLLFISFAILCLLWGIGISYDHARRDDTEITNYVIVELLVAIIMPIFLFIAGILLSAVFDYITRGEVDFRTFIPKFLPVVKLESGTDKDGKPLDFWVIEDTFYFEIAKHDHSKDNFFYSFDTAWATWFLNGIVCLGVHLAVAYFVDFTLDTQTTFESPSRCDTIDSSYQCFQAGTLEPVPDCMAHNGTVHCFKFLEFGIDFDLISAISTSYAFYLVASSAFTYLFTVVKVVLHIKPSKWWGLGFLAFGILAIIGGIILAGVWIAGYALPELEEILHFNIINLAQYFMVCTYILMVGLLLVVAKWWENVPVPDHTPKVKKELVHYHDTSRGRVESSAHEHAQQTIAESKDSAV